VLVKPQKAETNKGSKDFINKKKDIFFANKLTEVNFSSIEKMHEIYEKEEQLLKYVFKF
jgi:hypothetical protein